MPQRHKFLDEVVSGVSRLVLQESGFIFRLSGPALLRVQGSFEARYFPRRVAELALEFVLAALLARLSRFGVEA